MGTYAQLREAILTRQQVVARYAGHERVFCPHILGWKGGAERCLVYQFAGSSRTGRMGPGSPDGWRCLKVDEVEVVRLQPGTWYTGASHERTQSCLDKVDLDSEKPETLVRAVAVDIASLKGVLSKPGERGVTVDAMNAAIARRGKRPGKNR